MRVLFSFILVITALATQAQSVYAPYNKNYYNLIDRYEIKNGSFVPNMHTSYKEYRRDDVVNLLDSLYKDTTSFSKVDHFNLDYLYADNWQYNDKGKEVSKKPFLKHFYTTKSDIYSVNTKDFKLRVNPVIYWQGGKENNNPNRQYINTRGVQVEGSIDNKIGFYTFMADNQAVLPYYVNDQINKHKTYFGEGFLKRARKDGVIIPGSVDFFTARGYFTFKATKHINGQFGHGKHFIGNGYRSLILSDNATNYLYLRMNTKIWKFNYTNLFAEMNADNDQGSDRVIEKKYLAFHHLSLNLLKNLNVGLWESIPFGRNRRYFELQYLNPIIFYRSIEQQVGSGDNAILGMDMHWNFLKHGQIYSQIVLDEFFLSHLRARDKWWANKQAIQLGAKYIDAFGLSNLDLQGEWNYIRPYTYSHKNNYTSYTHYLQPLAHPLGANLRELIGIVRYQPLPRLNLEAKIISTDVGLDFDSVSYGSNPMVSNLNKVKRPGDLGHHLLQGNHVLIKKMDFTASYMLKHNLFFDFNVIIRNYDSEIDSEDTKSTIIGGAMRWNIGQRRHDY